VELVIAIMAQNDDDNEHLMTGLQGEAVFDQEAVREVFVVPFSNRSDAADCLRILLADLQREPGA